MKRIWIFLGLLLVMGIVSASQAQGAPDTGTYSLAWWSMSSGGGAANQVAGYRLSAAAGQAEAGWLSGGEYVLRGGFTAGIAESSAFRLIFLPLVSKP